ncbi:alpha/beta hydrolase [Hymenobacter sp. BT770]|uniref:alpha/beta hydrolase n=1 Tax=Hymenobacter sp. BT770 TaxID=2886942 RepID=UPI001D1162DA|nr:alpha/beta hydrolase [Hymenobacter sp. BT770]MCC3153775.1 alpha/beta hydrolase [Hymenobacter sp. BT770]MDO3416909.1 alpha/beta hydrolase [Hymenobacter sp. BT770]
MRRFFLLMPLAVLLAAVVVVLATEYVVARPSHRTKDVAYVPASAPDFDKERHVLDVYSPNDAAAKTAGYPVVLFIHGGSWTSGSKNIYTFIGRRLAKQGVVAVVINYRLAPTVHVPEQAADCARALAWTVNNIGHYGGDPARVFVMGHSAGGGLAALLATDDALLARNGLPQNPVRGAIMDDPAGLDMYSYLKEMKYEGDQQYLVPFGKDPAVWKEQSAIYKIKQGMPPFMFFIGGETYPSISGSSGRFRDRLKVIGQPAQYTVLPGKHHIPMVLQLYWQHNIIYQELLKMVGA